MDVQYTYCGKHFMMYVGQIIMLYTLILHSAICQLYINKTGREKKFSAMLFPPKKIYFF